MDSNNTAINEHTKISQLILDTNTLMSVITVNQLDNSALDDAILKLDISQTGFNVSDKKLKLHHIINCSEVTILNVIQLHKTEIRKVFKPMFLAFILNISTISAQIKSQQIVSNHENENMHMLQEILDNVTLTGKIRDNLHQSTPSRNTNIADTEIVNCLKTMTTTLSNLATNHQCPNIGSNNQNSQLQQKKYAKLPTTAPPSFDNKKKNLSLRRFFDNIFMRWMTENKLDPNDRFLYLHKCFISNLDKDRAWSIISRCKAEGIDRVLVELQKFFNLDEVEIYDLQQRFFSFKIQNQDFIEGFYELFELSCSIQGTAYNELKAIESTKIQFKRSLRDTKNNLAQSIKAVFLSTIWKEAITLDLAMQVLRQIVNGYANIEMSSTIERSVSSMPLATSENIEMDVSAVTHGRGTNYNHTNKVSRYRGRGRGRGRGRPSQNQSRTPNNRGRFTFINCPRSNCKARNVSFAKHCQICGSSDLARTSTNVIDFNDSNETADVNQLDDELPDVNQISVIEENDTGNRISSTPYILNRERRRLPLIHLKFYNEKRTLKSKNYKALFDTGACLSYMDYATFERIKHRYNLALTSDNLNHRTANGQTLQVHGYIVFHHLVMTDSFNKQVELENVQVHVVSGLSHQFIIGTGMMKRACRNETGFIMFPSCLKVMLGVEPSKIGVQSELIETITPSSPPSFYALSKNREELHVTNMIREDFELANIEPLTLSSQKITNIGSSQIPIFTSSQRSDIFKTRLKQLIHKFHSRFSADYSPFNTEAENIKMSGIIPTGQQRFIPLQPILQDILREKVTKMISDGILELTDLPANCCLMLTEKNNDTDRNKSGAWRVINDLVLVNKYVDDVTYHLPPINHLLNQCEGYNIFSKVDIPDAYFNVPIKADQPIIAMVPGFHSNVKFTKLPQGLKSASAIFSRVIDKLTRELKNELLKYLDDLLIRAKSETQLLMHLEKFLEVCQKYNIRINLRKSIWGAECLEFLSFKIFNGRVGISDTHRQAIQNIDGAKLSPETLAGFLSYFGAYTNDHDLINILRSNDDWSSEKELALKLLKNKILTAPMRSLVSFKEELRIYCDASDTGFSTALFQVSKSKTFMEPVSFYAKNMSRDNAWKNKNIYMRELHALSVAVSKYEYMLRGYHRVIIYTDNKALAQSGKSRSFVIKNLFDRIRVEFPNVKVEFIEANRNSIADIMSRAEMCRIDNNDSFAKVPLNQISTRSKTKAKQVLITEIPEQIVETPACEEAQSIKSEKYQEMLNKLTMFHVRGGHPSAERIYELYRRLYPDNVAGITIAKLRSHFKLCKCARNRKDNTNFVPRYASINKELFLDFKEIGTQRCRLKDGKKSYRLSILEPLSGAVWSLPTRLTTGKSLVTLITMVLMIHGKVDKFRTDNAPQFIKGEFESFCRRNDIAISSITPYNPCANPVERHHSNLNRLINLANPDAKEVEQDILDYILSYNSIPSKYKYAPYEVLKGHMPKECIPSEFEIEDHPKQSLTALDIIDKVWSNRNLDNLAKTKPVLKELFPKDTKIQWSIKLNTGISKQLKGKVIFTNLTSAFIQLEHSGRKLWVAKNSLRCNNDPGQIIT